MLVKRKEGVNDGANETKSVKEAKRDERNKTDNRAWWNKHKVKSEEKKGGDLEKIDLKKIYSRLLQGEQSKSVERKKPTPAVISTNSAQLKNGSAFSPVEEDIFSTQDNEFLLILEEFQNGIVSNNIDSTTSHPTACTLQEKAVPLESQ